MSRKGYARLEDEMRRESRAPSSISRVDVWIKGHTRKERKSMNEVLDATVDQSNGVSSLANVKCKLLHWEGSNLVVAEGQIASKDPKSKVHHATLGPLCWKVWVNHVTVNVPLFRSTREMYDLQDAIGSTVAWPSQFILLD
ncbi:unnamed protein product [Camellia sinensis]